jgi:hypothetical protein
MMTRIEEIWSSLRREAVGVQRRVDATHRLDLYADFEQPDRPGLVLFCEVRPNDSPSLKAIGIERRQRQDGRWSMRIFLLEPRLLPVFAELCRDIIEFTRSGIEEAQASGIVLSRIDRWRSLMQAQSAGMSRSALRGLIGELLVLETQLLPELGPDRAVSAWTGPLGTSQDFRLPSGLKIEVKSIDRDANSVRINGLGQLDGGGDRLELYAVRLEDTGLDADSALTASRLIARLRGELIAAPVALQNFEILLRFVGWDDAEETDAMAVRLNRIDRYEIDAAFPRLTGATVPVGVTNAEYTIVLPPRRATT